jgi:hypothetical protein
VFKTVTAADAAVGSRNAHVPPTPAGGAVDAVADADADDEAEALVDVAALLEAVGGGSVAAEEALLTALGGGGGCAGLLPPPHARDHPRGTKATASRASGLVDRSCMATGISPNGAARVSLTRRR